MLRRRLQTFIRLLSYLKPYGWLVSFVVLLVFVTTGLQVLPPYIVGWIVDNVFETNNWDGLASPVMLLLGAGVLLGCLGFVMRYLMMVAANQVIYDLRNQLFHHLQAQSLGFYDFMKTGELMSRLTSDVQRLDELFGFGIRIMASFSLFFVVALGVMFYIDWQLAIVTLVVMPFLIHAFASFGRRIRPLYTTIQERTADLTEILRENIAGVRLVQVFARERLQQERLEPVHRAYYDAHIESAKMIAWYQPYMKFLAQGAVALVLLLGGLKVINGTMSLGDFVAFNIYLAMLVMPIEFIGWIVNVAAMGIAAGDRIFEVLDTEPAVRDRPGAVTLERLHGEIVYEGVGFSYDNDATVLREINLAIAPGMKIAILGTTGSGKTTLTQLMPRFYDPTEGRITIAGTDIRELSLDTLRRNIGIVHQETFLFNTTIRDNIAYGRPGASDEAVARAAKAANIHQFIVTLPDGYETLVGDRGVRLSGGQKQRLAIARALLVDPPILILDESTSSVDATTERLINQAVRTIMADRTSLVIAHRLSTVRDADRVVIMRDGRIVEEGTHDQLAESGRLYQILKELQEQERRLALEDEKRFMEGG